MDSVFDHALSFRANLSTISHLNAIKLIISTLEMDQYAFHETNYVYK